MNRSLRYLLESLSNYENDNMGLQILQKVKYKYYEDETDFVDDLKENEIAYLDSLLEREIRYAKSVHDDVRVKNLNDVYEILV